MVSIPEETEKILKEELRGIDVDKYLENKESHEDLKERIHRRLDILQGEINSEIYETNKSKINIIMCIISIILIITLIIGVKLS